MDDPRSKHGKFSWNELLTTDPEGAKEFYGQLFGWTTQDWPMDGFNYTIVKAGDTDVGGIMPIPSHATGMPPTCNVKSAPVMRDRSMPTPRSLVTGPTPMRVTHGPY